MLRITYKPRTYFISLIGLLIILTQVLSSCRNTNNVVSSNIIQKRKYNKGYYVKLFSKKQDIVKPQITDNSFTEITNKQSGDIQTGNANDLASATDDIAVSIQKKSDSQSAITATADKIINILKRKGFNTSRIIKSSEISTLSRKEHFGIKSGSPNKLKHSIVRLIFYILLILFIILIFAILASALGASGFLATLLKPVGTGGGVLIAALLLLILILLLL